MHSMLFVAVPSHQKVEWSQFLRTVDAPLRHAKNVARLSENVWLVTVNESLEEIALLIVSASQSRVAYGVFPFEHEPQWLPAGFDPSAIPASLFG